MDVLVTMRKKHRERYTNRVNVDIHSGGGWSAELWSQAEVCLFSVLLLRLFYPLFRRSPMPHSFFRLVLNPSVMESVSLCFSLVLTYVQKSLRNIYASPSLLITARSASSPSLIKAVSPDRILVESDTHDVRLSAKLVWGAVEWIGRCKGWSVEGSDGKEVEPWEMGGADEDDDNDDDGRHEGKMRTVRILERNWARFMRIID